MLAGMMFAKEPFFKGTDNDDQLIRIAKVIGADDIRAYVEAFDHIELSDFFKQNLLNFSKKDWYKFVNSKNEDLVDEKGFDLLTKMLTINHTERITAKDAIEHEFFDEVRASVKMSTMQIKQWAVHMQSIIKSHYLPIYLEKSNASSYRKNVFFPFTKVKEAQRPKIPWKKHLLPSRYHC